MDVITGMFFDMIRERRENNEKALYLLLMEHQGKADSLEVASFLAKNWMHPSIKEHSAKIERLTKKFEPGDKDGC